jgi:hypothetical protein
MIQLQKNTIFQLHQHKYVQGRGVKHVSLQTEEANTKLDEGPW